MGLWNYSKPPTPVRDDPLGPIRLRRIGANQATLFRSFLVGHKASGEHNTLEVARTIGQVRYSGGWTLAGPLDDAYELATGHEPGTGALILTPKEDTEFGLGINNNVALVVNCVDSQVETKPCIIQAVQEDGLLKFNMQYLSSALSGGNTWAYKRLNFDLAVYAQPHKPMLSDFWSLEPPPVYGVTYPTHEEGNINALFRESGEMRRRLTTRHTAGVHTSELIATQRGDWDTAAESGDISSFTIVGPGEYEVGTTASFGATRRYVFGSPNYDANCIVHFVPIDSDEFNVYIYELDGTLENWARAACHFTFMAFGV